MPRLSHKQDGLALVHQGRAGVVVARRSRERRAAKLESVRMGKTAERPPGPQAAADLRRDPGRHYAPVDVSADAPGGEIVRTGQEDPVRLDGQGTRATITSEVKVLAARLSHLLPLSDKFRHRR